MVLENTNSRKLKAVETKRRIYENAVELFKKDGFDISVDSIVGMAGVSKGTFYVHYESKFSLIAEYVDTLDLGYEDYFSSLPPDSKPSTLLILITEKIADIICNSIGYDLIRIVYEAHINKTLDSDSLLSNNRKLYQIYKQIIQQGVKQGEFKSTLNIDSLTDHFIMSIRGMTYEWCIRFPNFNLKDEILRHFDLLLSGIKNN